MRQAFYVLTLRDKPLLGWVTAAAMASLKHADPECTAVLFTDAESPRRFPKLFQGSSAGGLPFDDLRVIDTGIAGGAASSRFIKTQLMLQTSEPFVYLDVDTLVVKPVKELWEVPAGWEGSGFAACQDVTHYEGGRAFTEDFFCRFDRLGWQRPVEPYFNSGVFYCGGGEIGARLGARWHELWSQSRKEMGDTDQPALHTALRGLGVQSRVLPWYLNHFPANGIRMVRDAKVLHFNTRSAMEDRYWVINALARRYEQSGELDLKLMEHLQKRGDPFVGNAPGFWANLQTGRYFGAVREGIRTGASRVRGKQPVNGHD